MRFTVIVLVLCLAVAWVPIVIAQESEPSAPAENAAAVAPDGEQPATAEESDATAAPESDQSAAEESEAPAGQESVQPAAEEVDLPVIDTPHKLSCTCCHSSGTPSAQDVRELICTRPETTTASEHPASEAPDVFLLDQLSDIYVPVVFPHKLHASMTKMGMEGESCSICHHRNPPGPILACNECHGGPSNPVNLEQPGLKGAYHRQCLSCHREWSHETDCVVCHAKREPGREVQAPKDPTDIMGMLHPNVEAPNTKIYHAKDMEGFEVVTFHHREHAQTFGLDCTACHRQENCNRCHDIEARTNHVRETPHQDCVPCHQPEVDSDCAFCHAEEELPTFDHARRTGFDLTAFHEKVTCRSCHPGTLRFEPVDNDCTTCHEDGFDTETFDHGKVGMALDDLHKALSCGDCHPDGMSKPGRCDVCHDDGRKSFDDVKQAAEGDEEQGEGESDDSDETDESEEADDQA